MTTKVSPAMERQATQKNVIINGNFDIWQRGTSQTAEGYGSDDRWKLRLAGSAVTHSRQTFTLGQTDVPNNPTYHSRNVITSVSDPSNHVFTQQKIEGFSTLAGETVTLSFWAKVDAPKNITTEYIQQFGSGGSPSSSVIELGVTTHALTTAWKQFTVTFTLPSISGKTLGTDGNDFLQLNFWFDAGSNFDSRTNSLGQQSGTFDIAQVQMEKGNSATEFERRTEGEELLLCQRYYEELYVTETFESDAATTHIRSHSFAATKRATPSITKKTQGSLILGSGITFWDGTINTITIRETDNADILAREDQALFTADAEL